MEVVDGDKRIAIFPHWPFRISSSIDFRHPLVGRQSMQIDISAESYTQQIAPARTFGFLDEIPQMKDMGPGAGRLARQRRGLYPRLLDE